MENRNKNLTGILRERSFCERLGVLFRGLRQPVDTRAYKEARIEAQRLFAPVAAFTIPLFVLLVMAVFTNTSATVDEIRVAVQEELPVEEPEIEEEPPPPEYDDLPDLPDPELVMDVDVPPMGAIMENVVQPVQSPVRTTAALADTRVRGLATTAGLGMRRGGGGKGFGSGTKVEGDLVGRLYDFKRDADGKARSVNYWTDLKTMVESISSHRRPREVYSVPREVYLSHLFVPYTQAEAGPEAFGVADLMEAKGWVAHYSGQVQPLHGGEYRFVGDFDDTLIVLIDGKTVLEVTWDHANNMGGVSGWTAKENVGTHRAFTGRNLVYGDWVELNGDQPQRIDVFVGERPGGMIGGVLLVERKGETYGKNADGSPVLPVFAVSTLSMEEQQRLDSARGIRFARQTPVMKIIGKRELYTAGFTEPGDIKVNSGSL